MSVHPESEPDDARQSSTAVEADQRPSISKDDAFHILQNVRRRAVMRYLLEQDDEEFRMRDIAEAVAAWEHDTTVQQLSSDERQRVYIALYQSHLPKLAEHGIIDYNQSRGIVQPRSLLAVFAQYLADGLDTEDERLTVGDAEGTTEMESTPELVSAVGGLFSR